MRGGAKGGWVNVPEKLHVILCPVSARGRQGCVPGTVACNNTKGGFLLLSQIYTGRYNAVIGHFIAKSDSVLILGNASRAL